MNTRRKSARPDRKQAPDSKPKKPARSTRKQAVDLDPLLRATDVDWKIAALACQFGAATQKYPGHCYYEAVRLIRDIVEKRTRGEFEWPPPWRPVEEVRKEMLAGRTSSYWYNRIKRFIQETLPEEHPLRTNAEWVDLEEGNRVIEAWKRWRPGQSSARLNAQKPRAPKLIPW